MKASALETLLQVNEGLRAALVHFRPDQSHCSAIRVQDFCGLLQQLLRASECLRAQNKDSIPEPGSLLERQVVEYRANLEKLKQSLPDLHARLLSERARLEVAQTRLANASAWAQTQQETL